MCAVSKANVEARAPAFPIAALRTVRQPLLRRRQLMLTGSPFSKEKKKRVHQTQWSPIGQAGPHNSAHRNCGQSAKGARQRWWIRRAIDREGVTAEVQTYEKEAVEMLLHRTRHRRGLRLQRLPGLARRADTANGWPTRAQRVCLFGRPGTPLTARAVRPLKCGARLHWPRAR